jgi:GT2 family glycosyltransferase
MTAPLVVSVILNTNRRADTLACLASLRASNYSNHQALVLDNASTDGSVEAIRAEFPEARVLCLERNLGYAGNNNVGIGEALKLGAEWVWVLNEDVVVAPDALSQMMALAARQPGAGTLGPLVYHASEPTVIQTAGGQLDRRWHSYHRGQNQPDTGQYTRPELVDWISGCAILVRRAAIEQAGVLDERYFYYWEETEWCLRLRRHGWQAWCVPAARAWHKGVQREYQPSPHITYYATRNWLLTLAKHRAPAAAWLRTLGWVLRNLTAWTLQPRWRAKRAHRDAMWHGLRDFIRQRWGMRPA